MVVILDWLDILFEVLDYLEVMVQFIIDGGDGKRDILEVSVKFDVNGIYVEIVVIVEFVEVQNLVFDWEYDEFEWIVI